MYLCKSETILFLFLINLVKLFVIVHGMLSARLGPVSVKIWLYSLPMSTLSVHVLLFYLKHVGNCVLNLCLDIISSIAFHVFAALNLHTKYYKSNMLPYH